MFLSFTRKYFACQEKNAEKNYFFELVDKKLKNSYVSKGFLLLFGK